VALPPKVSTDRPVRFAASTLPSIRKVPPDRRAPTVKPWIRLPSRSSRLPSLQASAPIAFSPATVESFPPAVTTTLRRTIFAPSEALITALRQGPDTSRRL
jgi:hypothetical protein